MAPQTTDLGEIITVRTKYRTYGPWITLDSQSICSGLEDFLLWVVLGRETQSHAQLILTLSLSFLKFSEPPSSPNFPLFIAKVSGEIVITAIV